MTGGLLVLAVPLLAAAASLLVSGVRAQAQVARAAGVGLLAAAVAVGWLFPGTGTLPGPLSVWYLLLVTVLGSLGCFASVPYVLLEHQRSAWPSSRVRGYFGLYYLLLAALVAVGLVTGPLLLWGAVEAAGVAAAPLVAVSGSRRALEAAWKYLVLISIGGFLALLGLVILLAALHQGSPAARPALTVGLWLAVAGFAAKAGLAPFHTWLPDAHAQAPPPVAGLAGAELAAALYAILRVAGLASGGLGWAWPRDLLAVLGLASLALAVVAMAGQRDLRRLLGYSSIEHMGVMALGVSFGGIGLLGALLHAWTHGLAKSGLFLGAGTVEQRYGGTAAPRAVGVLKSLPWTGPALAVLSLAIAGAPPWGLFFSEWLVVWGGVGAGHVAEAAAAAILMAVGVVALAWRMPEFLLGRPPADLVGGAEEAARLWPILAVGLGLLLAGPLGLVILHGLFGAQPTVGLLAGWR